MLWLSTYLCLFLLIDFAPCLRSSVFGSDPDDMQRVTDNTRKLGRVVIRGPQISLISPQDGMEEIANPFLLAGDDDGEDDE